MTNLSKYSNMVYRIIGAAMIVHSEMGYGLLEPVYYKNHLLDKKYKMDIVVDDIIVELKSVSCLVVGHRAQLCNYLRLTRKPLGLLINFGEESLIGERWAYDKNTNECFLVDRNMERVKEDYSYLLDDDED